VAEVELEHEKTGERRRFYHRPSSDKLRAGDRVLVKLLLACLMCCLPAGCERSGGARATEPLPVREVRHWSVPADGPRIPAPRAVTVGPADEVYVLDTAGRVLVYDRTGRLKRSWRMPESDVGKPEGVLVLADGTVAVADTHYHRVVFFAPDGRVLGMLGREGRGPGEFGFPVSLARDEEANLYVAEYGGNDRVQKFAREARGSYKYVLGFGGFGTGRGEFQRPSGIVWQGGRIIVADAINHRIQVFSDAGEFVAILGEGLSLDFPYGIALREAPGDGSVLYVIEYGAGRISSVALAGPGAGKLVGRFGTVGAGKGQFFTPWGIAVDSAGRLRVADTRNRRIVALELSGSQ
jgi:DNA-binding beta-propeller fold protein YncE